MTNLVDYLYFWARSEPDSIAIQRVERAITYRELLSTVQALAVRFREAGIRPGNLVATCIPETIADWIVTLGLMHEAAITCSSHGFEPLPDELIVDRIVSVRPLPGVPDDRVLLVTDAWLNERRAVPDGFRAGRWASEDDPARLVLTSGTTGKRKAVAFSTARLLRNHADPGGPEAQPSAINLLRLSTSLGFRSRLTQLVRGATVFAFKGPQEAIQLQASHGVEVLIGSPIQLNELVRLVESTSNRPTSLRQVVCTGGAASATLLNRIRGVLCTNVVCRYGSTEAGGVAQFCSHDPNAPAGSAGYVLPGATVQIVDAGDRPLRHGEEGAIRIRTSYMATGYHRNAEETARSFKDGWFYPGDRGMLVGNDMLVLAGRESELINRGGIKIDPVTVDQQMQAFEGIRDAASFGFETADGIEDMCALIVAEEGLDIDELRRFLVGKLGVARAPSIFLRVREIPRNQMGKPMRAQMRERLGATLREKLPRNAQDTGNSLPGPGSADEERKLH